MRMIEGYSANDITDCSARTINPIKTKMPGYRVDIKYNNQIRQCEPVLILSNQPTEPKRRETAEI